MMAALRHAWPDAHITWMVERRDIEAIDANPFVDEILVWESMFWKRMTRSGLYPIWLIFALRLRHIILGKRYDVLISYQPEDWPTLTRILSNAIRIGIFDTFREYHGQTRTSRRARLYNHAFTFEDHPAHRVDQYLLPLRALGLELPPHPEKRLVIGYTAEDVRQAEQFIDERLNGEPFVVIAPMTGWPSRIWPLERYAAVADAITSRFGLRVVLVSGGSAADRAALETIARSMKTEPVLAAAAFGFRGLAALIARARLVVSGDTGPMHLASALDTPYVALFGPSPVERFAPLVGRGLPMAQAVPCGPCHQFTCPNTGDDHQLCLKKLTVEDVLANIQVLLRQPSPAGISSVASTFSPEVADVLR